jgi:hypothetical protein
MSSQLVFHEAPIHDFPWLDLLPEELGSGFMLL